MVVVDDTPAESDLPGTDVDRIVGLDDLFFEGRGCGDNLERRARLVNLLRGTIPLCPRLRLPVHVGVEARPAGERQYFSRVWIHHDDRAARSVVLLDPGAKLPLGNVLEVLVDGQLERRACRRRPFDPAERPPSGIGLNQHGAGTSLDHAVVLRFEPLQPGIVDADVSQDLCREVLIGIEAPVLLHEADALEIECRDAAGIVRRHLATHVREGPTATETLHQRLPLSGAAILESVAERRGRGVRVTDFCWNRVNRVGFDAVGEHAAVAVENVPTLGRRLHGAKLLALGTLGEFYMLPHLEVHKSRLDGCGPCHEHGDGDDKPPLQRDAPGKRGLFGH